MCACVLKNVAPNHRANDVMVLEHQLQILSARFMYGPLDMVSLSGEKVPHKCTLIPVKIHGLYNETGVKGFKSSCKNFQIMILYD